MIDPAVMADIRSRINPQYQDTIGTESYERLRFEQRAKRSLIPKRCYMSAVGITNFSKNKSLTT